ncbi:MAG TPA: helix-turn-helix transcriptional regulator [Rhodanobacter sp.]|nr:helix-turn-helix transcriptional regulator [Rhodanobacter sp.]
MGSTPILLATQLGDILRSARLSRDLTQTDIARELGISTQAVSKLENNAARASFERIHRLCQVLGLELLLQEKSAMNLRDASAPEW